MTKGERQGGIETRKRVKSVQGGEKRTLCVPLALSCAEILHFPFPIEACHAGYNDDNSGGGEELEVQYFFSGSSVRLLTSAFSHMDFWHLGVNMFVLWSFAPHVEGMLTN